MITLRLQGKITSILSLLWEKLGSRQTGFHRRCVLTLRLPLFAVDDSLPKQGPVEDTRRGTFLPGVHTANRRDTRERK